LQKITKIFGNVRNIVLLCTVFPKAQDCSRVDLGPQAEGMRTLRGNQSRRRTGPSRYILEIIGENSVEEVLKYKR
jgi:hypothetical protein